MDANSALAAYRLRYPSSAEATTSNVPGFAQKGILSKNSFGAKYDTSFVDNSNKAPRVMPSEKTDKEVISTYQAIAKLYGEENAAKMAKAEVKVLGFDSSGFAATKAAFVGALCEPSEDGKPAKYTEADVEAMVTRNPLLLNLRATGFGGADTTGDETMYASYVIAATRPAGPFLLGGLFLLLATPAIKAALGINDGWTVLTALGVGSPVA